MRVGVEVGGTFTDLIALDGDELRVTKVPSVPRAPEEGVFAALPRRASVSRASPISGTARRSPPTRVLERKGADRVLVTTDGFRDLLGIQRHDRRRIYDLLYRKPAPLVRRRDVFEVRERLAPTAAYATPLDEAGVVEARQGASAAGSSRRVAVCMLNAYANPAHEQRIGELRRRCCRRRAGELLVRDQPRVPRVRARHHDGASAYVQPIIDSYLGRFEERLAREGFRGRFSSCSPTAARLPPASAAATAITALFSGPAAGVIGAIRQVGASGCANLITLRHGRHQHRRVPRADGKPIIAPETSVDGLPIRTPAVDIDVGRRGRRQHRLARRGRHAARRPAQRRRRSGPGLLRPRRHRADHHRRARRRGTHPRRSLPRRAHAARRRGGARGVRAAGRGARHDASSDRRRDLGSPTPTSCARSSSSRPSSAATRATTSLVPFGGAGPLHARRIAEDLGIATIVVPQNAGVLSAFGLLAADYTQYDTVTRKVQLDTTRRPRCEQCSPTLRSGPGRPVRDSAGMGGYVPVPYTLQMRFVGQAFEVGGAAVRRRRRASTVQDLARLFDEANRRVYMHSAGAGLGGKRWRSSAFARARRPTARCPMLAAFRRGAERRRARRRDPRERGGRACTVAIPIRVARGEWRGGAAAGRGRDRDDLRAAGVDAELRTSPAISSAENAHDRS